MLTAASCITDTGHGFRCFAQVKTDVGISRGMHMLQFKLYGKRASCGW
jgi:hypothetical protein